MLQTFRICPICKLPGFREQKLCRHCALELRKIWQPTVRENRDFIIRSLFSWDQASPAGLTDLVYAMKGVEDSQAWLELALWMVQKFNFRLERPVIVPVPGTRPNHALGLASALGRVLGYPVWEALVKASGGRQKVLGRAERAEVRFRLSDIHCTDYRSVIIVDDVATTGATAQAAFEALGRPKICEVWCLLDRRPCGP